MNVCVVNGVTGEHLATLAVEHTAAARQVQQLLKSLLGIPKKEQRLLLYNGVLLRPFDHLPAAETHSIALIRVLPTCSNCGTRLATLRSCAGCLDAHYCDVLCQRAHWRVVHRAVCISSRSKCASSTAGTIRISSCHAANPLSLATSQAVQD